MSYRFQPLQSFLKSAALVNAYPFTFSAWFKNEGSFSAFPFLVTICDATAGGDHRASLYIDSTGAVGAADRGTAGASALSSAVISDGNWHHCCAVFTSASSRAAFLDGANKGTNATAVTRSAANETSIGAWRTNQNEGPTGLICAVSMFNTDLSDAQVLQLAQGRSPLVVAPANLVRLYKMRRNETPLRSTPPGTDNLINFGPVFVSSDNPSIDNDVEVYGGRVGTGG